MRRAVMETKIDNTLKQVLEKRKSGSLSSNFTFRMMEQIRVEAVKQERRKKRNLLFSLLAALFVMLGTLVYYLFFLFRFQSIGFYASFEAVFNLFPVNSFLCLYCVIGFGAFRDRLLDQEKKINI